MFCFPEATAGRREKADVRLWRTKRTLPGVRALPEATPQPRPCCIHGTGRVVSQHNIYGAASLVQVGVISVNTAKHYYHYHYYCYYFLILPPKWEKHWFHHFCDYSEDFFLPHSFPHTVLLVCFWAFCSDELLQATTELSLFSWRLWIRQLDWVAVVCLADGYFLLLFFLFGSLHVDFVPEVL